jgi:predicted alpha/beta hydrolase
VLDPEPPNYLILAVLADYGKPDVDDVVALVQQVHRGHHFLVGFAVGQHLLSVFQARHQSREAYFVGSVEEPVGLVEKRRVREVERVSVALRDIVSGIGRVLCKGI